MASAPRSPAEMSPSKKSLLEKLLRGEVARQNWEAPLEPRAPGGTVPIAPGQQLVYLSSQMTAGEPVYNEPVTIHYRGPLHREHLERAFNEVLRRHEILRTTFASVDGEVVQAIHEHLTIQIPFVDLSNLPTENREAEANRAALADVLRRFDLGVGPLIRARIVKLDAEYHRLYLTMHHIIFDRVSTYGVIVPELAAIYKAFIEGQPSPLSEPRYQFADFALWQKRLLDNDSVVKQTAYWREQLAGDLPEVQLPADRPRPAMYSYRGGMKTFEISSAMTAALKSASQAEGATLYMFLLAGFKTLLHRYSGQEDILVGGVSDARRRPEFAKLMGHFLNFLALRTRPAGEATFREYLAHVKDTVLGALANSDVPFDRLIRDLQLKRESARRPFFQATFSMEPAAEPFDPHWDLTQMDIETGFTKLDLYLEMDERPDGLIARFIYSTDLFDAATIDRMTGHWLTLLQSSIDNPNARLCDLAMIGPVEERQLRSDWNDTARALPSAAVHQLFEQQVARTPNAIAIEAAGVRITYRQLNERANRLAHRLCRAGVKPGTLVALCVERTADLAIAPLAVLKSGGAYLPLDPSLPKDRLAYLVEDAQAPFLLTTRSLRTSLPDAPNTIFCDEADAAISNPDAGVNMDAAAYVRYTSGSTGRPKGVEIHHRALLNLLLSMQREPGFSAADSLLAVTTFSFDIAELEIFLPLISGGRLVIASRDDARDPLRLIEKIRSSKCNVMQATPATWRGLVDAGWNGESNLKAFCGGEALPRDLAELLLPRVAELWNLYGPTETTVWSAVYRVESDNGPVPIGHPIDNTQIYVLDAHRKLVPIGVTGELYIGGAGVARGYLRRDELTRERFVTNPLHPDERLYRTGDVARWRADGTIECLGRIDNQIKIRGFRVEPGEIEAALLDLAPVRAAAVRTWPDASGNLTIAAYITADRPIEKDEFTRFLQEKLPEYMIPSRFVTMDALPLTPNGKVDRNALPQPPSETAAKAVAPRNATERKLVAIWESVLDVRPIGIKDNFFDLGGHSFLVAKLLRRLESEFGRRLSMAAVFEAPTIETLARSLQQGASSAGSARAITLQPAGSREPMFWIDGGPLFRPLAIELGASRPFVSVNLEASNLDSANLSLPEAATALLQTIRALQPRGPYHLGGWCVSGLLAYEVASQLIDAGQEVALVALLDSPNPTHYRSISKHRILASKTAFHIRRLLRTEIRNVLSYSGKRGKGFVAQLFDLEKPAQEVDLTEAAWKYDPKPIRARVLALQPADRPGVRDLSVSWANLMKEGKIEVRDIPGDHLTALLEPNVAGLARAIKLCLRDNVVEIRRAIAG